MKRDIAALGDREFDLVVVGAGVYGATIAWDASLRGLSVALIDKGDFGSGTSFNNLKTIHGGIRYIQHADFRRIRESVRERRNLMRIAPHLVHPIPFLLPTYRGEFLQGKLLVRAALVMNDFLSWDRNLEVDPDKHLPSGKVLSRSDCLEAVPGLNPNGLTGGALWYDAQMYNSDRLTLSYILSAAEEGAVVANFVQAEDLVQQGSRVVGVRAKDTYKNIDDLVIRGKLVVNAAGPWVDHLLNSSRQLFHCSKAINIVTRRFLKDVAVGVKRKNHSFGYDALGQSEGVLCLIPWRDVTLIGTSHSRYSGKPDEVKATEEEIESLLANVNAAYPAAMLNRSDVRLVHWGLLPAEPTAVSSSVQLAKHAHIEDHKASGIAGLLSVVGVKYTTARDVAEKVVDLAMAKMFRSPIPSSSNRTPIIGGDIEGVDGFINGVTKDAGINGDVMRHLALTYGTSFSKVLDGAEPKRLAADTVVTEAEIRHAVREEMALDLESIILRRTELGTAGKPSATCIEACASIVSAELGWSETRKKEEMGRIEQFFRSRT